VQQSKLTYAEAIRLELSELNTAKPTQDYVIPGLEPYYSDAPEFLLEVQRSILSPPDPIYLRDEKTGGLSPIDNIMCGIRPHEITIVCGASGRGKTQFMVYIAERLRMLSVPQYIASIENGREDFVRRLISSHIGENWNKGLAINPDELNRKFPAGINQVVGDCMYFLNMNGEFPVELLTHSLASAYLNHGIKVAIIDNLNFFCTEGNDRDNIQEMRKAMKALALFVRQTPIHIFLVAHPKKGDRGAESTRIETEYDIYGSLAITQLSDNVILFNEPTQEMIDNSSGTINQSFRELKFVKLRRSGDTRDRIVLMRVKNGVKYEQYGSFKYEPKKSDADNRKQYSR